VTPTSWLVAPASIETAEELREALFRLHMEHEALARTSSHAQQLLDALDALLGVQLDDDPFARVFLSLRKVFVYSHAMLLAEGTAQPGVLECIAADPDALIDSRWPTGPLFDKVMKGRVVATFSHDEAVEWSLAAEFGLSRRQSALYVPVRVREQRGILVLLSAQGEAGFDRASVDLARRFSVLASHALATRVANESAAEGQRLRELTQRLQQSEQEAKRNADLLNEVVNVLPIGLTVQDEAGRLLVVNGAAAAALGSSKDTLLGELPFAPRGGNEADAQRRLIEYQDHLHSGTEDTRESSVNVAGEERTLLITGKPVRIFDELLLVSTSLDITERKRFEMELSRRAFHDQLTDLPNRALMAEIVGNAVQTTLRGGMFALAFIDIDNFKQVNDYYSHASGDALLIAVAGRIREKIRSVDTLARISGDEFLLLVNPLERLEDLLPLIDRVVESLKQPFAIEGHEVLTSASVGASIYPLHGDSYETLRRCADSAMYRAKHHRKGSASYFDVTMDGGLTARMAVEQRLRVAIRERHFRTAFQPKVDLRSARVEGFEALVRWVEPDGGVRMPAEFIDLAAEIGVLDDITRFVLEDVAHSLPVLTNSHGAHISVSLNIGAKQAGDTMFMQSFLEQLNVTGIGRRLVIELTEEALVATHRFERQFLPELRRLGVRVSIDDFGTGYSSLSTLADITADEVKVDRAFITDIHQRVRSQGILKAIESLCLALDVSMVAEGVETVEELAYLQTHTSIRFGQGYLFSKPMFLEHLIPVPALPAGDAAHGAPIKAAI
jgi:diguanylate cyclase (GGDEF)-like protein/PAS domain S-box-containing protein